MPTRTSEHARRLTVDFVITSPTQPVRRVFGGTLTTLYNGRVLSSTTDRATVVATSTGHVGADARLHAVSTKAQLKLGHYARGLQLEATLGATVELQREGSGTLSGTPSVQARARAAGATAAQKRATAAAYGTQLANDPIVSAAIAAVGPELRARLLAAEPSWYDVPNDCVDIDYTPGPTVRLDRGQRAGVSARVHPTHSGGDATGTIAVTAVSHGTFTASRTDAAPGAPALFGAVAADPVGSFKTTVDADLFATSTAGRAKRGWFAIGEPPAAPAAFIGTISLDQTMPGYGWAFAGVGNFTRTALTTWPDGTIEAWYRLDAASLSSGSNRIGDGCGWIGQTSGTGAIDGDLELRIGAGGGCPTYAIRYEVEIDAVVFAPQCLGFEPFTGTVSVRLDSGRPGPAEQRLRAGPADFHLRETDVADVTVLPGASAHASWDLVPQ